MDFTVTMQPGDNFVVAASPDVTYIQNLSITKNGIDIINSHGVKGTLPIPATTDDSNDCEFGYHQACRTDMLTVWRRLHIEVDSMGNVGRVNKVDGTVSENTTVPASEGENPGVGNINSTNLLTAEQFNFGRLVTATNSLLINSNTTTSIQVLNTTPQSINISAGTPFTLYDDDDFNADDSIIDSGQIISYTVDGDEDEQINILPDAFKHLSSDVGIYDDGTPRNILYDAYLLPEYDWAQNTANYNQTNLTLDLNIESDGTINDELHAALNNNRGSKNDERDDFWIGYFLIAYQGEIERDADADSTPNSGISTGMPNSLLYCDCYQSTATCPSLSPPPYFLLSYTNRCVWIGSL